MLTHASWWYLGVVLGATALLVYWKLREPAVPPRGGYGGSLSVALVLLVLLVGVVLFVCLG